MKAKYILLRGAIVALIAVALFSCTEKDLEPTLAQEKKTEIAIKTVSDLQGALNGAFDKMTKTPYYGCDFIMYGELRSDNCRNTGGRGYFNPIGAITTLAATLPGYPLKTWNQIYNVISSANLVIEFQSKELIGDKNLKNYTVGQAYAIRALAHFDLLKLYGQQHVVTDDPLNALGIPYIKKFKIPEKEIAPFRDKVGKVKEFIYEDLKTALNLMQTKYNDKNKAYPDTYTVNAIKSRVGTYFGDWDTVVNASKEVFNGNFKITPQSDYVKMWRQKDRENTIWELAFSSSDNNKTSSIQEFFRGDIYGNVRVDNSLSLVKCMDEKDVRRSPEMIGPDASSKTAKTVISNLGKFPSSDYSDNIIMFRIEEIVLNYAEALWRKTSEKEALNELNKIAGARGISAYTEINQENILLERRRELCFEGFRFDDLARCKQDIPINANRKDVIKYGVKGDRHKYAFPIPQNERNANINLEQNEGY